MSGPVTVIGGGIAGSEAAFQLAARGISVRLVEMRPRVVSPAHHTDRLAELVCSNSMKSADPATAAGMLKTELRALGSVILSCAEACRVPAGGALAVDRDRFSAMVTELLAAHPSIELVRGEATDVPEGQVIVATGPLTSAALEPAINALVGGGRLAFYDAAAPIVDAPTIDRSVVFAASRYDKGEGADYLNCPMDQEEYGRFIDALVSADRVTAKDFETSDLFQACQPAEETARRGPDALRYGAMKPVGLTDPRTGRRPWAVVQLRAENSGGTAYNLVGFQTNLTFAEQSRVFRLVPGLERAEFLRFGVMHRNTYIDAPRLLDPDMRLRDHPSIRVAGQLAGTEGYLEAAASGLVAALSIVSDVAGRRRIALPGDTALGALLRYATDPGTGPYQPMHVNIGLMPVLDPPVKGRRERYAAHAARAVASIDSWLQENADLGIGPVAGMLAKAVTR